MDTKSYWIDTVSLPRFPKLENNLSVDVAVIGAGITGITAAYLLKKAGHTVALIERERCAVIDTGHTTAHLTCVTDLRLEELVRNFGRDHARAVWDSGLAAIDQIHSNIQAEEIECEFRWVPGYLHGSLARAKPDPKDRRNLMMDATLAQKLGFKAAYLESVPYVNRPGFVMHQQAKFHPRKYLSSLIKTIPGNGSHVFEHTPVEEVTEKPLSIKALRHAVSCKYVVLATHTPLMGKTGMLSATLFQTKLALYTSYAVGGRIGPGLIPEASFWDTSDPYFYLRIDSRRGFDYAIFGGEDHKTGQERDTRKRFNRLQAAARTLLPGIRIDHEWSGQVIETNDGLPLIGETAENQFAATGFAGNGMTFGTLAAMMARDRLAGRKNPWGNLYDINRKKIKGGAWDYIKENADYPYYMVRDRLAKAQGDSLAQLKNGTGKILKLNGQKVAAFKDENGAVSTCSPVCTHLGCIVDWNDAEKTWDCPCHGSRFKPTGEVISGPAETPLEKIGANAKELKKG